MNTMDEDLILFHDKIDKDAGLKSKRRSLILTSLMLIIICWTGATIKEFSGLVAKIEVANAESVRYLLLISIAYLMMRYFAYAKTYHSQLRAFWVSRFMKDKRVFYHYINQRDMEDQNIEGLLGRAANIWVGEEPSISGMRYENHKTLWLPFFGRKITYLTKSNNCDGHPEDPRSNVVEVEDINEIILTKFTKTWKLSDYFKLIVIEYSYVLKSYTHHREYFDLMGPYIFGLIATLSYFYCNLIS
jgi:hypothetical protein